MARGLNALLALLLVLSLSPSAVARAAPSPVQLEARARTAIQAKNYPRAIKLLVEACRRRAASHDLRVVLATQSQTVLDQFHDDPSHVFVLEPDQETSPQALTELFSPEYLGQFSLGDLFAHLEFGGDAPPAP